MNAVKYNGPGYIHPHRMRHSFHEINRIMCLIHDTASFVETRRRAENEGIKLALSTISIWYKKYNLDFNSKNGMWGEKNDSTSGFEDSDAFKPGLLNIYLNNEYKCIIKVGECIPPEFYEKKPCTIRVESIKLE